MGGAGAARAPGPRRCVGSLSGRQTRVLPLGAAVGWAVYRMVTCLDPDCVHFHSRIAKIFLGFWRREREVG